MYTLLYMKQKRKHTVSQGKLNVNLTIIVVVMLFLVGITSPPSSQIQIWGWVCSLSLQLDVQEVSDQELTRFGNTLLEIQQMEVSAKNRIDETVQNSELSTETLNELFAMQSSNPEEIEDSFNKKEISEFNYVMVAINTIYVDTQKSMHEILKNHSYDLESFHQMAEVIQEDEQLLGRLQALFNEQG